MKQNTFILIIVFCASFVNLFSQSLIISYDHKEYNFKKYYYSESARMGAKELEDENKILCYGNYNDTLKSGNWIYFYPSGKPFGIGKYKNGFKIGKWKYFYANSIETRTYLKKHQVKDNIFIDQYGKPEMTDTIHYEGEIVIKHIGHQEQFPVRFVD
jgi:antitoxin component YwqK of YwqJK toxin-antitoxin module